MKNALDWMKANPISVAAAGLAFVGLLIFLYLYLIASSSWSDKRTAILAEPKQQQDTIKVAVPLPNEDPNAEPESHTVVVNQKVIDDVKKIYSEIKEQYDRILQETGDKNAARHRAVLLGRGAIWPDANRDDNFDIYFRAKEDYLKHFSAPFDTKNANPWNMPRMYGGSPPRPREVQIALARTAFNFISSIGVTSAGELTQTQAELLYAEQRTVLMNLLTQRARGLNIYVALPNDLDPYAPKEEDLIDDTPELGGGDIGFEGAGEFGPGFGEEGVARGPALPRNYPFDIQPWARADDPPHPNQLWEGQVELWIIRDVMQAIHDMNRVGKPVKVILPDGTEGEELANVLNSPIKRLLRLDPLHGYVGLHTVGGVLEPNQVGKSNTADGSGFDSGSGFDGGDEFEGGGSGFDSTGSTDGTSGKAVDVYPKPADELAPLDPTEKAPEHFGITPTGRVSNSVFDVRHTRVIVDIEGDKLPAFIEQLRKTNFMTAVKVNVQDVDEYQMLRDGGYVYGDVDVVRAELIIESLWFRNWTTEYMPKRVKEKLLIIQPEDAGLGDDFGGGEDEFSDF